MSTVHQHFFNQRLWHAIGVLSPTQHRQIVMARVKQQPASRSSSFLKAARRQFPCTSGCIVEGYPMLKTELPHIVAGARRKISLLERQIAKCVTDRRTSADANVRGTGGRLL